MSDVNENVIKSGKEDDELLVEELLAKSIKVEQLTAENALLKKEQSRFMKVNKAQAREIRWLRMMVGAMSELSHRTAQGPPQEGFETESSEDTDDTGVESTVPQPGPSKKRQWLSVKKKEEEIIEASQSLVDTDNAFMDELDAEVSVGSPDTDCELIIID